MTSKNGGSSDRRQQQPPSQAAEKPSRKEPRKAGARTPVVSAWPLVPVPYPYPYSLFPRYLDILG
jgi:hypothetical protein